jgi:integrase
MGQKEKTTMAQGSGLTRAAIALTHRSIEALRPAEAPYRVPDQRCKGLAIRISPGGVKSWDLAYRIRGTGKVRRVSLGRVGDVTLEEARERAHQLTSAARQGRDLVAEEDEARETAAGRPTIEALIELYVRRRVVGRLRTARGIESRLRRALAPVLERYANDIRRRDLRQLFEEVAQQGFRREAEQRRQIVGTMFKWAVSEDLLEADPTAGLKGHDPGTPRDRVLSFEEIEALWKWLDNNALPSDVADILRLQLLLGARCGEISEMHVEEINCDKWLWTLPAARSKNKKPRVTPLIGVARHILEARLANIERGLLFVTERGTTLTSSNVGGWLWTRRDQLPIAPFVTHDLRRTAATTMAELGISLDVVAAVVGHEGGSGKPTRTLVRHYIHSDLLDRKTHALRAWDERLKAIVTGEEAAKVVRLSRP